MSPSPSTSIAKTEVATPAVVEITCSVKLGGKPPSLSYHAILLSWSDAERTSVFPSPSTSMAKTETAPLSSVEITRSVKVGGEPPSFSVCSGRDHPLGEQRRRAAIAFVPRDLVVIS